MSTDHFSGGVPIQKHSHIWQTCKPCFVPSAYATNDRVRVVGKGGAYGWPPRGYPPIRSCCCKLRAAPTCCMDSYIFWVCVGVCVCFYCVCNGRNLLRPMSTGQTHESRRLIPNRIDSAFSLPATRLVQVANFGRRLSHLRTP